MSVRNLIGTGCMKLVTAVLLLGGCSAVTARDAIVFSHHLHTEQGLSCTDCHTNVTDDAENKIARVSMTGCSDCHDVEDSEGCRTCHTNPDDPQTYLEKQDAHLLFSHQQHQDVVDDCSLCHQNASHASALPANVQMIPGHRECTECHEDEMDNGRCNMCHDRLDIFQRKPVFVFSHENGFFSRHGLKAAGGADTCAVCHDQAFCGDCHNRNQTQKPSVRFPERVDRTFMHAGDWMSRHPLEAKTASQSCLGCHGTSYCSSCHERNGRGGGLGFTNPHPPMNVWMARGTADSHGAHARRDIVSCASCHDQGAASNCVECHRSGLLNPHPPGWKAPVAANERGSHPMCAICH